VRLLPNGKWGKLRRVVHQWFVDGCQRVQWHYVDLYYVMIHLGIDLRGIFTKAYRPAIILLAVLNVAAVLRSNCPMEISIGFKEIVRERLPPRLVKAVDYGNFYLAYYSYIVGLDNVWKMFGYNHRYRWKYLIEGVSSDGRDVVLPIFFQSQRTFFDQHFFDFKQMKFYLNIYNQPAARNAFAKFLCREHVDVLSGQPFVAVKISVLKREILPRETVLQTGQSLANDIDKFLMDEVSCASHS